VPELPEVERGRRILDRVAVGRRITKVIVARDPIMFDGRSPAAIRKALLGARVVAAHRRGKHLWLELDRRPWPTFHFGMTGGFHTPAQRSTKLVSHGKIDPKASWPPRFTKIHLYFNDGGELVMSDARRFGRIRLANDPLTESPISDLGFDPLLDLPTPRAFIELVRRRNAPMKAVLLDQGFAAGVGNWIADEVLYQTKISPRRPGSSLSESEAKAVRVAIRKIITTAVDADCVHDRFPRGWLFHHRWGKNAEAMTSRGEKIVHETIGGRTTAWVPEVQR